jgi:hypothetical protein
LWYRPCARTPKFRPQLSSYDHFNLVVSTEPDEALPEDIDGIRDDLLRVVEDFEGEQLDPNQRVESEGSDSEEDLDEESQDEDAPSEGGGGDSGGSADAVTTAGSGDGVGDSPA